MSDSTDAKSIVVDLSGAETQQKVEQLATEVSAVVAAATAAVEAPSQAAVADVVAAAVPTVEDFVKMCLAGVDKKPTNKKEALALFKYVMTSKVEPLVEALLEGCIEKLPADQQAIARQVLNGVEAVSKLTGCGCF